MSNTTSSLRQTVRKSVVRMIVGRMPTFFFFLVLAGMAAGSRADAQTLRVMRTGLGEGAVSGTGIMCGTDCTENFATVQMVTLTASPMASSNFAGWGGDCASEGTDPTCDVTVSAVASVRARFEPAAAIPEIPNLTPAGIRTYLAANPAVDTPAEFIFALPDDYSENWIMMVRSESLQTGTATSPRILLPSRDFRRVFTVGMTEHSSYPGSHPKAIEFMEWSEAESNFRFHEIVLGDIPAMGDVVKRTPGQPDIKRFAPRSRDDTGSRGVTEDDAKCFACHSTRNVLNDVPGATPGTDGIPPGSVRHKSKPNWDTYDSWGGMLAFNRDRLYQGSVEVAAFRRIFNLWTWQNNDDVRSVIEQLRLQPAALPPGHPNEIKRDEGGGADDGHISFIFDNGAIVTKEALPAGSGLPGSTKYAFDGTFGAGGATTFAREGEKATLNNTGFPGCFLGNCSPGSDEGRGVNLFDELFGTLNPRRVADEVADHRYATGSILLDARPLALAVAQRCISFSGGSNVSATQTITSTPALSPSALSALDFFNQRHGVTSFDEVYDDTRLRQVYLPLRKADIQRTTLDRTSDPYAYDPDRTAAPPPPAIVDGLVQAYGAATDLFNPGTPLSANQLLEKIRAEVFRRLPNGSQPGDATLMDGLDDPTAEMMDGIYVDREVTDTARQMALYRYFLEPLGISVDKWSIAVRGRSRTYTMADVFMPVYDSALVRRIAPELGIAGNGAGTCSQIMPKVEALLAPQPPAPPLLPPATGPGAMPTYTDIQRIFNKSCIECHGGLGYPPYQTYRPTPPDPNDFDLSRIEIDLSENETPPVGERRLTRSYNYASSDPGFLLDRITDYGRLAHPYDPDERYNVSNPDDPADPDVLDERCPYGLMPCGGPPLSGVDIETIRRWADGSPPTSSEGDPHIRTIDGVNYDLQTAGEFVLLRDEGFELQARHTPVTTAGPLGPNPHTGLSTCVSVNTAVALRTGGQRITYQPSLTPAPLDEFEEAPAKAGDLVLRIDGAPTELGEEPILLSSGGRIRRTPVAEGIQIEHPGGTVVVVTPGFWAHHQIWYLNINVRRARSTQGLMGQVAPGNWLPALADGTWLGSRPADLSERYRQLHGTFADAWRVTETTSLFDYEDDLRAASFAVPDWPAYAPNNCVAPPVPGGSAAPAPEPIDPAEAERLCGDVVGPDRRANCVADVAATGEAGFAEAYVASEQLEQNVAPTEPTLGLPANFAESLALPIKFTWSQSTDADRAGVTYRYCLWSSAELFGFDKCTPVDAPFASRDSIVNTVIAALALLILLLVLFLTVLRHRPLLLVLVAILLLPLLLIGFHLGRGQPLSETVASLDPTGRYLWKVVAEDENGAIAESETRLFTVR
jgi:hypothetical protein